MTINRTKSILFQLLAVLLLISTIHLITGCAAKDAKLNDTPEPLAKEGLAYFNDGDYYSALEKFKLIKERHPFSRFSLLAELKAADCEYFLKNYKEALALYEEFENKHPTNEAIPYVLFQIGRCHFQQIGAIDRDPTGAHNSIQAFNRLIKTFPKSSYINEARIKIKKAENFLADHELYVANYYMKIKSYQEAQGRINYLQSHYPESEAAKNSKDLQAIIDRETAAEK
ncbi:MAG: outer membrane protein assembly factor BamD [Proteobacteria bacterium]|nr:outer membrane protein assembly factor BamD [Pseudomonadota bacterium]MBU1716585.1 outer membrane protein assembly factor BamD [Pseudomonadota bacterium]